MWTDPSCVMCFPAVSRQAGRTLKRVRVEAKGVLPAVEVITLGDFDGRAKAGNAKVAYFPGVGNGRAKAGAEVIDIEDGHIQAGTQETEIEGGQKKAGTEAIDIDIDGEDDAAEAIELYYGKDDDGNGDGDNIQTCKVARTEERALPPSMKRILLRNDDGTAWPLGRLIWTFLDVRSQFTVRMVDQNRSALTAQVSACTPIHRVEVEFQSKGAALRLSTSNIMGFSVLSPAQQTPATLLDCLVREGLDLYGNRFSTAKNAAYVLHGPFSSERYVRLSARQTRVDLHSALRLDDGEDESGVTVVVAGPIPKSWVPRIHRKEREMQRKQGFFADLGEDLLADGVLLPPRLITAQQWLHRGAIYGLI